MSLAERLLAILASPDLATKLAPIPGTVEDDRARVVVPSTPARSDEIRIVRGQAARVPPLAGFADLHQRRRILHALANHELQAVELFAWALLRFEEAPEGLRSGWRRVLGEEQCHARLYMRRLEELGGRFGDHPVSGYFWKHVPALGTPLHFICAMALTFENANLDHAVDIAATARRVGDEATARVLERVHEDEIGHVRLGWHWLLKLKQPQETPFEAFRRCLCAPLHPGRATGHSFHEEGKLAAGLDPSFVEQLREAAEASGSGGRGRR